MTKRILLPEAIKMEYYLSHLLSQITRTGWKLDRELAERTLLAVTEELTAADNSFLSTVPLQVKQHGVSVTAPFLKSGGYKKNVIDWMGDDVNTVAGGFSRVVFEQLNMNSPEQIKEYLLTVGWSPTAWTEKGSPQVTEDSLERLNHPAAHILLTRGMLAHRKSLIEGLIKNIRDDGRVPMVFRGVTETYRAKHSIIANIPKSNVPWGHEIRSMFTVEEGNKLIGCDVKSAQLRILAHYMQDDKFTEACVDGDLHQFNADLLGLTRDEAKTFIYAFLFGASDTKIGGMLNLSPKETREVRKRYLTSLPKLSRLLAHLERFYKANRFIPGLDGRKIECGSQHKYLNYLVQGAEAVHMRTTLCFFHKELQRRRFDVRMVGWYHDEWQSECGDEKIIEEVMELKRKSIVKASTYLGIRVPMDGDPKVGNNWAETH